MRVCRDALVLKSGTSVVENKERIFVETVKRRDKKAFILNPLDLSMGILFFLFTFSFLLINHDRANSQTYREDNRSVPLAQVESSPAAQTVQAVESIGMTVGDMERSIEFYSKVLSFKKVSDVEVTGPDYERLHGLAGVRMRVVRMQLGSEVLELTEYLTPKGRPIPFDSRSNDRWFQHIAIVVSDMNRAYQHLRQHKIQYVSTAPQRLPDYIKGAAGVEAFYFRDPDGHNLEIIHFPSGKGDPKWQGPTDQLFLGIDHSAIAVSNTEASFKFYRNLLGLKLVGESENYGTEQEHLNNVFGAHLRISSLRSPAGPGIEFLEYMTPLDGRPIPADARPNDLMHWHTTVVVSNASSAAQRLRAEGLTLLQAGVVEISDGRLGFKKGFLVRDPDGHVLRVIEK